MKILLALITVLSTQLASASFLEACEFGMTISKVEKIKTHNPETGLSQLVLPMTGVIKTVVDKGGHTDCQHHIGQEMTIDLEGHSLEELLFLNKGYHVSVNYFHVNSLTPDGVFSNTTTTIISAGEKAFQAAVQDSVVSAKVQELHQTLGIADDEVVLLKGSVQSLPEGLCGFVGCSSTHLVTLTYGQNFMNSPRQTIVVKVHQGALGDNAQVIILE